MGKTDELLGFTTQPLADLLVMLAKGEGARRQARHLCKRRDDE